MSTSQPPIVTARTIPPNGELIQQLRKQKGWTIEEMAATVPASETTIKKLEAGRPTTIPTLKRIAIALGAEYESLLLAPVAEKEEKPKQIAVQIKYFDVEIKLSIPFPEFDECDQLTDFIQSICRLLPVNSIDGIKEVSDGSTIVVLQMTEEAWVRLWDLCLQSDDYSNWSFIDDTLRTALKVMNEKEPWHESLLIKQFRDEIVTLRDAYVEKWYSGIVWVRTIKGLRAPPGRELYPADGFRLY